MAATKSAISTTLASPWLLQVSMLLLLSMVLPAAGHSYIVDPPARNLVANWNGAESCPHCLQAGGPGTVSERAGGVWPSNAVPESHGLCGDPVQGVPVAADWRDETYLNPTPVQRVYSAGDIVEFVIGVSTHHQGHYEWRLCNKTISADSLSSREEGQACFNSVVLERAPPAADCQVDDPDGDCQPIDDNHPGRWYLPPSGTGSPSAGGIWDEPGANSLPSSGEFHHMRYMIPHDVQCDQCTLQWYWSTGNSCLYDGDYITYFQKIRDLGWDAASWCAWCVSDWATCDNSCCGSAGLPGFGEEFWNCADISVLPSDGPSPSPSPGPTPGPTTSGSAPPPSPNPCQYATTPSPPSGPCAQVWQKCGGSDYTGPTCCEEGSGCNVQDDWYSQCVPGGPTPAPATTAAGDCEGPASTPAPSTTPAPVPTTPAPSPTTTPTPAPTTTTPAPATTTRPAPTTSFPVPTTSGGFLSTSSVEVTTSVAPTPAPTTAPSCAPVYGQCGGNGYSGPLCCAEGSFCEFWSKWYSQCKPTPPNPDALCSSIWGQCGGVAWAGSTCCESGSTCVYSDDWYSQCSPA